MAQHIEIIEPDARGRIRKIGFVHFMSISTFAASMGYCGMCFGWRMAHQLWGAPAWIGEFFGACALVLYVLIFIRYFHKLRVDAAAVRAEWNSPTRVQRFNCIAGGCAGTVSSWTCQLFLVCRIVHHHGVQLDFAETLAV